ncbi:type IV toxin-antitoxin system AbiEi family antitoxin domain-containing protein [Nocardioides rubriscoriae]|uniref:type IV toxin-antitoxin system AbiEi family antitoxin domain-containing protein n=1 Tax=Nocardioides rubriscoriae TaxID=642762 RepID=UPI0011E05836|nr:type IV toxin-antitoxin system AbiEi family antitoxin domain-containing protein [Nocardioides rubriscoriae]
MGTVVGMMRPPPQPAIATFCDPYGILLRREAIELGIDDNALRRLVDCGTLVRLRQGAYCLRSVFLAADDAERHRLLARAVMRLYGDHVALSHASSVVMQRGPDFGLDLSSVHLTHFAGGGRKGSRVVHHLGETRVGDVRRQHDFWLTVPARAVVEVACTDGTEAALVQANHFLHQGAMTVDELHLQVATTDRWPGSLHHHPLLLLASAKSESVGETRSDLLFWRNGLPRPELQYEVTFPDGTFAARVDFAWPALRVIVEFDGRQKYHRFRQPGESIEQMVEREKRREDLIRELTGWTVIRLVWADLDLPQRTVARIRRAMHPLAA